MRQMDLSVLSKQVGPLPIGGWLVGVGGGVAYLVYKNRNGGSDLEPLGEAEETATTSPYSAVGTGPGGWVTSPLPPPATPDAPIITNQQWAEKASRELMGRNYDAVLVDSMVRKAVGGLEMTAGELVLFRIALTIVGPLPEVNPPAAPVAPVNPTVPPPTAPPPAQPPPSNQNPPTRYYTVVRGDTLWGIAARYYGNGALWTKIYNANRNLISNPSLIYPGQKLVIPY